MKILFISEFQANTLYTHSTNIVIYNLIKAFHENNIIFHSILMYDHDQDINDVKKSLILDGISIQNIQFIQTLNPIRMKKKLIQRYIELFRKTFSINYYKKRLNNLNFILNKFDIVITHSPSIDSIALFKSIKKSNKISFNKYFQLWSDPIAAAGVDYSKLKLRRNILKILEAKLHSHANKIFFFTDPLYLSQKKLFNNKKFEKLDLFSDYKNNIFFSSFSTNKIDKSSIKAIYFGNYQLKIRDIRPLYNSISSIPNTKLTIIGQSNDLHLKSNSNVTVINQRFPKDNLYIYLNNHNFIVAVLNKETIQIPGKIFFDSNIPYPYLIILDGPHSKYIQNYLSKFKRFYFVDNSYNAIKNFFENYDFNKFYLEMGTIKSANDIVDKLISFY